MINIASNVKIYICCGHTDMRKGITGLSILAASIAKEEFSSGAMFIFRGKSADKIKILWWDEQGFCMFYKCLDRGKFPWLKTEDKASLGITRAQLSMLMEGVDWRSPRWSATPLYAG